MVKQKAPRVLITGGTPDGGRDEFAALNERCRGRRYEGHWFRAAKAWDDFVRPSRERQGSEGGTENLPYLI